MLHEALDAVHDLVQAAPKGRSLPTARVPFHAQAVGPGAQSCEPDTIVILRLGLRCCCIAPAEDQMVAMNPDRHP